MIISLVAISRGSQVDLHCQASDLIILGYYHANESNNAAVGYVTFTLI